MIKKREQFRPFGCGHNDHERMTIAFNFDIQEEVT